MYDVESFVTRNFDDYRYYGNPVSDIQVCCTQCEDTKYHLHINLDSSKPVVHCFRCGYSASWIKFVMDVGGLSYWNAVGELYVIPRIRGDIKEKIRDSYKKVQEDSLKQFSLPEDFQLLYKAKDSKLADVARAYMVRRGFSVATCKKYNIGVSYMYGVRIVIPIDRDYWQGRAIFKWQQPKYYNPKEPARDVLFNRRALDIYEEVVICEGAFSAMAVGDNAIALIGKEPTEQKIRRILDSEARSFIIALESNAYKSMKILLDTLIRNNRKVVVWKYVGDGDPADKSPFETLNYDMKSRVSMLFDEN